MSVLTNEMHREFIIVMGDSKEDNDSNENDGQMEGRMDGCCLHAQMIFRNHKAMKEYHHMKQMLAALTCTTTANVSC